MWYRDTQDSQVMVENSEKMWSTGEGNGKPLQYSCLENLMKNMRRQKNDMITEDEPPRSVGIQYTPGEELRNSSRRNEEAEPKRKQRPVVDVSDGRSQV